ncbi:tetratricopeptide repeat protein [Nonomuraea africana]|uniref:tetratricopeptide repeat protein n=1 Tax=Nonomuraea africana TaxID=46171 RepID=UPI0033FF6F38
MARLCLQRAEAYVAKVAEFGDALPAAARAAFTAIHLVGVEGGPITDPERLRALIDDCARTGALRRYPMLLTIVLVMAATLGLDELVDEEIARVRSGSDRWAIACTFMIEAMRYRERGDRESSATAMAAALHAFEEAGDRWWTAKTLYGMAQIHAISGERDEAIAAYERAIAMATDLGSQDEVSVRLALATERMRGGDLKGARHDIATAERAAGERGQPMLEIEVIGSLAELYRRSGEIDGPIKNSTGWRRSPASCPSRPRRCRTSWSPPGWRTSSPPGTPHAHASCCRAPSKRRRRTWTSHPPPSSSPGCCSWRAIRPARPPRSA